MGIFDNCLTHTDQGNIGLAKAIYELQVLGYRVSIPLTENQKYDLICEKNDTLYRIQVKTTKQKSKYGIFMANLRTVGGSQKKFIAKKRIAGDYDLLYVLTENNISFLIPDSIINANSTISLGKNLSEYIIKI